MPLTTAPLVNVSRSPSTRRRGGSNPAPIVPGVDSTPNAFTFTDVTNAATSTLYESNTITVAGIDTGSSLSIVGGEYSLNGGAYATAPTMVQAGDTVKVRATSSGSGSTAVNVTLTIGGVSDTYTVTTGVAADTTPDAFTFTDVTGATLSTVYVSNTITVGGINAPTSLSISGGEYSINGGAYASSNTTVSNGDTVKVRGTSSGSNSTAVNVSLTIGGVSDVYSITTVADSGSALWTPATLGTDLVAWYDASDSATVTQAAGAVSQISDKSGNGRHMVQATGSLQGAYTTAAQNGLNALTITNDWMEASVAAGTLTGGLCFATAWRVTGTASSGFNGPPLNRTLSNISAPVQGFNGSRGVGTGVAEDFSPLYPALGTDPLSVAWNVFVQSITLGTPGGYEEWINGTSKGSFNGNCSDAASTLTMASRSSDRGIGCVGIIGETIATKLISYGNRQRLEGYLAHKWGLTANLPAGHPYKASPPPLTALWTPAELGTDVVGWYDAQDAATIVQTAGAVSQWNDKSTASDKIGNATQATGAQQPAYQATGLGGSPAMYFAGSQSMTLADLSSRSWTAAEVFYIRKLDADPPGIAQEGGPLFSTRAGAAPSSNEPFSDGSIYLGTFVGGGYGRQDGVGNPAQSLAVPRIIQVRSAPNDFEYWIDGAQFYATATNTFGLPTETRIGVSAGTYFFKGHGSEIIVCKRTLTTLERQQIEGYLAYRWGLQANLPAGHPYKSAAPTTGTPPAWTPAALGTDVVAWYDAQDAATIVQAAGAVSQWSNKSTAPDKIGSATQATGSSQPAYQATGLNGKPCFVFSGTVFLVTDDLSTRGWTAAELFYVMNQNEEPSTTAGAFVLARTNGSPSTHEPFTNGLVYTNSFTVTRIDAIDKVVSYAVPRIINVHSTTGDWKYWRDGTKLAETTGATFLLNLNMGIGGQGDINPYFAGKGGEIVVCKRLLTTLERQQVEGYLAYRWGLQANLPAGHPYKSSPP